MSLHSKSWGEKCYRYKHVDYRRRSTNFHTHTITWISWTMGITWKQNFILCFKCYRELSKSIFNFQWIKVHILCTGVSTFSTFQVLYSTAGLPWLPYTNLTSISSQNSALVPRSTGGCLTNWTNHAGKVLCCTLKIACIPRFS